MHDSMNEAAQVARFFDATFRALDDGSAPAVSRVLDFGCGEGRLVQALRALGYDSRGCDVAARWSGPQAGERLATIQRAPYRLPFDDESFDAVVSTSVLEHAQNTEELFREIHRVLRTGGLSIHLYPSKWYLPREPHIYVPLVNFMWPHCPRWWLAVWAWLGVRNEYQRGLSWIEVVARNAAYCETGLSYLSGRAYRRISDAVFSNSAVPMELFVRHGYGGVARLLRRLPAQRLTGRLMGMFRMRLLVQRKIADSSQVDRGDVAPSARTRQ